MTVPTRKIGQGVLASALLVTALLPATATAQGLRPSGSLGASGLGSSGLGSSLNARPASTGPRQADFIVVVVNSEPITNNEVLAKLVRTEQQLAQQGGALPPRDVLARQVLERMMRIWGRQCRISLCIFAQLSRLRWLRRWSARYQCRCATLLNA